MLSDTLRDGANGKIFKFLFWIIILSFIFAGVGNYLIPRLNTDPVRIGNYSITASQWNEQYNRQTQQLQRSYGVQAAALLEDPKYVRDLHLQVLDSMVSGTALNYAVYQSGIRIGDAQVREAISREQAFYQDGKFNNDLYLATLRNSGMSPEYYAEQLRLDLSSSTIVNPLSQLATRVLPYETRELGALLTQSRRVDLYSVDPAGLEAAVSLNDEQLENYYRDHPAEFMEKARVKFNYLLLSLEDLKSKVEPTAQELEDYYNLHQDEFTPAQRRLASQILIKNGEGQEDKLSQVQKALQDGTSFAEVARLYSEDVNTASQGGSLGELQRSDMDAQLGTALFNLKQEGDVSAPVRDDYGVHILRLDAIVNPAVPPFAEVKDEVMEHCVNEQARKLYDERLSALSDLSFENPDSLDTAARAVDLEVKDSGTVLLGQRDLDYPLSEGELQKEAFRESTREGGVNSQVIELDPEHAVVLNVYEYTKEQLPPFEQVKGEVKTAAISAAATQNAREILESYAQKLLADPAAAAPTEVVSETGIVLERSSDKLDAAFMAQIFALPRQPLAVYASGMNQGKPTVALLKEVLQTQGNEDDESQLDSFIGAQLSQYKARQLQQQLYRGARELSEVTYNEDAIDMMLKQSQQNSF